MTIFVLLTLTASCYLSFACFCIIHRMTRRTPWSLCIAIASIAALGAFGLLQSMAYLAGVLGAFKTPLGIACLAVAVVFSFFPRIKTERFPRHD
jgi:uncharacterized oligopeptide transporter (OPT) family protein